MTNGTVILLGNLPPGPLDRVVTEFGWSLEIVRSLDRVREMSAGRKLIADPLRAVLSRPFVELGSAVSALRGAHRSPDCMSPILRRD